MNIKDTHINFDIELDKSMDFESPYILPEQKDYWLNKAQDEFVEDIVQPKDPRKKGFEETQERIDDIRTLVKESDVLIPVKEGSKFKTILPTDYLHRVRHTCKTKKNNITLNVGGELVKQVYLNNALKDPFWIPSAKEPIYYYIGNQIVYETLNNFDVIGTELTYVRKPLHMRLGTEYQEATTDVDSELPEPSQRKILARAVSMLLENFESPRYQTNLNELNKTD
jgi:hypothetical protein